MNAQKEVMRKMGFSCGLVGLPNVGKSTIFNALTAAGADAANYPFCTIEPSVGKVPVPDERLQTLAEIVKTPTVVPALMAFTDIAGLIKGASQGEGLGNQFLGHIREVDAIAHVVRCFEDDDVIHVDGSVDPIRDIDVIQAELVLADLDTIDKAKVKVEKKARSQDPDAKKLSEILTRLSDHLNEGKLARTFEFDEGDGELMKEIHLLTTKPVLYIANVGEGDLPEGLNEHVARVMERAKEEEALVQALCGKVEMEIQELPVEERAEFLEALGLERPGLDAVIRQGYSLLGLQTYFTAGEKEARAWTIHKGDKAPRAAGVIHSDFEKGFIRAEIVSYENFIECGGEKGAREKGLLRTEGKEYEVQEGDVVHFLFNV